MRLDGVQTGQSVNIANLPDLLGKLNVGDIVKARVLEFTANELTLRLFDGSTVKAAAAAPLDVKKGDTLEFCVKSRNENQIVLETVKDNSRKAAGLENDIKKQLAAIDIKPDETNVNIAKEIYKYNLPLKKEVFLNILEITGKFKNLTPEKAAFLTANSIIPGEKSINSLNRLIEGKARLASDLFELADSLEQIKDKSLLTELVGKLSGIRPAGGKLPETPSVQVNPDLHENNEPLTLSNEKQVEIPKEAIKYINAIPEESLEDLVKTIQGKVSQVNIKYSLGDAALENVKNSLLQILSKEGAPTQSNSDGLKEFIFKEFKINEFPLKIQSEIKDIIDGFLNKTNKTLNGTDRTESRPVEKYDDTSVKSVLRKVFERFHVKTESATLKEDLDVKNLYKDMDKAIDTIRGSIKNSGLENKNDILGKLDNLDNNIRFLNQLNNHNTYVQIPLNILDKNTTGEIYILKRESKRKKIDPENVTMFISLDTGNMGRVDSLIGLDKRNVSINMRVEDDRIFKLIKDNYKDLYNTLSSKGYRLVSLNYRMIEEDPNVMNINELALREKERNSGKIDCRL